MLVCVRMCACSTTASTQRGSPWPAVRYTTSVFRYLVAGKMCLSANTVAQSRHPRLSLSVRKLCKCCKSKVAFCHCIIFLVMLLGCHLQAESVTHPHVGCNTRFACDFRSQQARRSKPRFARTLGLPSAGQPYALQADGCDVPQPYTPGAY